MPVLFEKDGRAMASSRDIAEAFGKRHDDVIKKFRDMDCSEDFRARNFAVLQNQTLSDPNYGKTSHVDMTRDGFTFLVMGFTGKDAAASPTAETSRRRSGRRTSTSTRRSITSLKWAVEVSTTLCFKRLASSAQ